MAVIYKLTNQINNKSYIGKSKNLAKRFARHCITKTSYIGRALSKYGKENFKVEVLYETDDLQELAEKEYEFISNHGTIYPNGYNLTFKTDNKIDYCEEVRNKISKSLHCRERSKKSDNKYVGAIKNTTTPNRWCFVMQYKNTLYSKATSTEEEAAILHDKIALFLIGDDAYLNFPEKRNSYTKDDLEQTYNYVVSRDDTSSKYYYVKKRNNRWIMHLSRLPAHLDKMTNKSFDNEMDAAKYVDAVIIFYKLKRPLNFPSETYDLNWVTQVIDELKNSYIKNKRKTSKYEGVSLAPNGKNWIATSSVSGKQKAIGFFKTEDEAYQAKLYVDKHPNEFDKFKKIKHTSSEIKSKIIEDYKNDVSISELEQKYKCNETSIRRHLKDAGIPYKPRKRKVDDETIKHIRNLRHQGFTIKDIANKVNLGRSLIGAIVYNRLYKDVI